MTTVRRALALLGLGAIAATTFAPVANADVFKDGQNAVYITRHRCDRILAHEHIQQPFDVSTVYDR